MASAKLYGTLDKAWKSTCRVLFGEEVGELAGYEEYLKEYLPQGAKRKSARSGKEVALYTDAYCKSASFISSDEIDLKRQPALSINDVKDIDSVLEGISEKWEYCGSRILGNCAFVENSDVVIDSQYVADSVDVEQSQYVYASFMPRKGSKYMFSGNFTADSEFIVRLVAGNIVKRCFEGQLIADGSDIYVCSNCMGCHDVMFSFNQRNKRNMIGNLELPREKYAVIKKKLVAEIADELRREKRFPSLSELVPREKPAEGACPPFEEDRLPGNMAPVEKAFASAYKIILKEEPAAKLDGMRQWLTRNTIPTREFEGPFGRKVLLPVGFTIFEHFPKERSVSHAEALALGKLKLEEKEIGSLREIRGAIGKIGYLCGEWIDGVNRNAIKTFAFHAVDTYEVYDATRSQYSAYSSIVLDSKYIFGCHRVLESEFCLKCYNSLFLSRCFELEACTKCTDSLFCHNSEALQDAMFCFNVKGKRHAVGNLEVGKEKYDSLKGALLEQINGEIAKNKSLGMDIYRIGCPKK